VAYKYRRARRTVAVLRALAEQPSGWCHGSELGQQVDLKAGAWYPILIRLCDRGLVEVAWEVDPPPGHAPRHLYRLSGAGARLAAEVASAPEPARTTVRYRRGELRGAW
jgi:PadR family transcriptional regulator, regulatory protein PadR